MPLCEPSGRPCFAVLRRQFRPVILKVVVSGQELVVALVAAVLEAVPRNLGKCIIF